VSHSHSSPGRAGSGMLDPDELRRHRRALRILIVILIPLAIWTLVGLIAFWPGDISGSVSKDVGFNVPGVTYPTARITAVAENSCEGLAGSTPGQSDTRCAELTAEVLEGDDTGTAVKVTLTSALYASGADVGQEIKLIRVPPVDGQPAQYQFSDFDRGTPLLIIALLFAVVVVVVARWRGFASLLGLGFAGFILVRFMFPALVAGANPILIGLIGSSAIMFVVLYAAHGFSARTTTALVGTLFGLCLSATLGYVATRWAHLTGVATEDDYVLAAAAPNLHLTSVVMCGIIIAGLGVLNDVTITQASAVWELADSHQSSRHLYTRAMRIGRDHIASTVYTIVFATAGASLSVLLLISIYDRPLLQVLQTEQFAGELIRTLVGSIGLVLAVPLTTAIGAAVVRASGVRGNEAGHVISVEPVAGPGPVAKSRAAAPNRRGRKPSRAKAAAGDESTRRARPEPADERRARRSGTAAAARHRVESEAEQTMIIPSRRRRMEDEAEKTTIIPSRRRRAEDETEQTTIIPSRRRRTEDETEQTTIIPTRRRRRSDDDGDFNFSDLRDPDDPRPKGRREF